MKSILIKIVSFVLVIAITAGIAVTGTLAYLQSEDSDVNVMTLGNVKIEQIEQERDENGALVPFTQAKPAYPAVGPIDWAATGVSVNGTEYKVFTPDLKNVVDKIVTVKNTGVSDAYVRTIVAIEAPDYDPNDLIHINYNGDPNVPMSDPFSIEIDGVKYVCFEFTYLEALKPGDISAPSLMQVFLDSAADNEFCEKFGDTWEILVLSQAVQTAGFESVPTTYATTAPSAAEYALDTAYGKPEESTTDENGNTAVNAAVWFGDEEIPDAVVSSYEELRGFAVDGGTVIVGEDITADDMFYFYGLDVTVDLNNKTITAEKKGQYLIGGPDGSTLTLQGNGTVEAGKGFFVTGNNAKIIVNGGTYNTTQFGTLNNVKHTSLVQNDASMVINGGTFTTNVNDAVLFWATSNSRIEINGGFFENTADDTPDLLGVGTNKYDTNRIILKGGTFVNYNPLNDQMTYTGEWPAAGEAAFGGPWILIPDGYEVISETQTNGDIWYTVVAK